MSRDDLLARARGRAEVSPVPDGWGYRVVLEEGDWFYGRWRGETIDEHSTDDNGNPRRIFLLWDEHDRLCFSRYYAALGREIDRVKPEIGCSVAIFRAADYVGQKGTGYSFGVEVEPNDAPLPGTETDAADDLDHDPEIPF
jgi:hypothetical protein